MVCNSMNYLYHSHVPLPYDIFLSLLSKFFIDQEQTGFPYVLDYTRINKVAGRNSAAPNDYPQIKH